MCAKHEVTQCLFARKLLMRGRRRRRQGGVRGGRDGGGGHGRARSGCLRVVVLVVVVAHVSSSRGCEEGGVGIAVPEVRADLRAHPGAEGDPHVLDEGAAVSNDPAHCLAVRRGDAQRREEKAQEGVPCAGAVDWVEVRGAIVHGDPEEVDSAEVGEPGSGCPEQREGCGGRGLQEREEPGKQFL